MIPLGILASARAASGWSPLDLPSLGAWFDASDAASITASAGRVSQWNDKSGNGYHATQATGSLQPLTGSATINGLNALDFDGTRYMASALSASAGAQTIAAVVYTPSRPSTWSHSVTSPSASGGLQTNISVAANGTTSSQRLVRIGTATVIPTPTTTYTSPATSLFVWTFDDGANSHTQRRNGAANGSSVYSPSLTAGRTTLIGAQYVPGEFLFGHIGELVMCSAVLTGTDLTDLETNLSAKWGV